MKEFLYNLFATRRVAFYLNLLGLTLAFVIFYVLMAEVKWVHGFDRQHRDSGQLYKLQYYNGDHSTFMFTGARVNEIANSLPDGVEALAVTFGENKFDVVPSDSAFGKEPIRFKINPVLPGWTEVFTFDMVEGDSHFSGKPHEIIVPLSAARKLFGECDSYLGLTFEPAKDAKTYFQVTGVYRDFPKNTIVSNTCYMVIPEGLYGKVKKDNTNSSYQCYLRLHKGITSELAEKDLFTKYINNAPSAKPNEEELAQAGFRLYPLHDVYFMDKADFGGGGSRDMLLLYFMLAILVVIIAAINYINFALAMIPYHIKAINVRKIFGASTSSLRLSLVGQTVVVILLSVSLAIGALWFIVQGGYLDELMNSDLALDKNLDVLCIMMVVALLVVLGAGAYPTWYQTSRKPALVINGNFALSERGRMLRKGLIGMQFTSSLVVIILLFLMNSQHHYIATKPVGYARDSIFYLQSSRLNDVSVSEAIKSDLNMLPDVVGASKCMDVLGEKDVSMEWGFSHEGQPLRLQVYVVEPDFLDVMGIQITEGRNFRHEDHFSFILNETARKEYGSIPLGTKFNITFEGKDVDVVGYAEDIHARNMRNLIGASAFHVNTLYKLNKIAIRVSSPEKMAAVIRQVEDVCQKHDLADKDYSIITKERVLERAYREENNQKTLVLIGSIISLVISLIGVFGLVLFETQSKRKEIGVRKVFGATTRGILAMFNMQYLRILAACFVIAAPVAYYLYMVWVESFAYRTPMHWWLFGVAFLIVAAIVCLTVTIQSWRAAKERPVETIMK
ncbi:MAG: ABC transporter permease [Bacteroidaceae bacterium]|nr:ABC transporter permease [Bacteroidaceae bacterium]